ncbi:MAG: hypothetical protein ABI851_06555 [Saprospiraceae bacterium]
MNNITILTVLFLSISLTHAQNSSDAYRFSNSRVNGTARSLGTGSSFGAIGADQSAIGINPAGLGLYRKSDFSFSLYSLTKTGKYQLEADPNLNKNTSSDFNINNIGVVLSGKPNRYSKWENYNLFIGYNNTANYKQELSFSGKSKGSILHRFIENSIDPNFTDGRGFSANQLDEFETKLAYETGAIYDVSTDSNKIFYTNDLLAYRDAQIPKSGTNVSKGYQGDISIAFGANYDEKIILGVNLDFPIGHYEINKLYSEAAGSNNFDPFNALEFTDELKSEISGFKGSLGVLYKPVNAFRIGLAWHSPGILSFTDTYKTGLTYSYYENKALKEYHSDSPDGLFEYKLITASKWIGSLAYVSKFGLINVDLDYFRPDRSRFSFSESADKEYQDFLNSDIKKQFQSVIETRIGIEVPVSKFRLRGGLEFLPSVYVNETVTNKTYSIGLGYRGNKYYIDLAARMNKLGDAYQPFATGNSDFNGDRIPDAVASLVHSDLNILQIQCTFGIRF